MLLALPMAASASGNEGKALKVIRCSVVLEALAAKKPEAEIFKRFADTMQILAGDLGATADQWQASRKQWQVEFRALASRPESAKEALKAEVHKCKSIVLSNLQAFMKADDKQRP